MLTFELQYWSENIQPKILKDTGSIEGCKNFGLTPGPDRKVQIEFENPKKELMFILKYS